MPPLGDGSHVCQAQGCDIDLRTDKHYCLKRKICSVHCRADAVCRRGHGEALWRFCFQCGRLQPLEEFDGKSRSCRARLKQRRKPQRTDSWSSSEGVAAWPAAGSRSHASKRTRRSSAATAYQASVLPAAMLGSDSAWPPLLLAGQGSMGAACFVCPQQLQLPAELAGAALSPGSAGSQALPLGLPSAAMAVPSSLQALACAPLARQPTKAELVDQLLQGLEGPDACSDETTSSSSSDTSELELERLIEQELRAAAAAVLAAPCARAAAPACSAGVAATATISSSSSSATACALGHMAARLQALEAQHKALARQHAMPGPAVRLARAQTDRAAIESVIRGLCGHPSPAAGAGPAASATMPSRSASLPSRLARAPAADADADATAAFAERLATLQVQFTEIKGLLCGLKAAVGQH